MCGPDFYHRPDGRLAFFSFLLQRGILGSPERLNVMRLSHRVDSERFKTGNRHYSPSFSETAFTTLPPLSALKCHFLNSLDVSLSAIIFRCAARGFQRSSAPYCSSTLQDGGVKGIYSR